jgi:molybdate transport system regulatory protein
VVFGPRLRQVAARRPELEIDPEEAAEGVFSVLEKKISKGEIKDINEESRVMNVDIDGKYITIPLDHDFKVHDEVSILISPDDIFVTLEPNESSVRNVFNGKIVGMEIKNEIVRLTVKLNNSIIYVDVTEYSREKLDLKLNMDIFIGYKAASATIIKI